VVYSTESVAGFGGLVGWVGQLTKVNPANITNKILHAMGRKIDRNNIKTPVRL